MTGRARNALYTVFVCAGAAFASWAARIPQVRDQLKITPGVLGLVLLCLAIGSGVGTPLSGLVIAWLGEVRTVSVMSGVAAAGLTTIAIGYKTGIAAVAAGLFVFGYGASTWDIAMNVQGARVEQAIGRSIMPRFHAAWSIGTVAGAGIGAAMVAARVPVTAHLLAVALVSAVIVPLAARGFLPAPHRPPAGAGSAAADPAGPSLPASARSPLAAWTEPRTLAIGLFVLCMTFAEGTGNDWLSLAIITGYHAPVVVGTIGLAAFLGAMTTGRWFGPRLIDSFGRVRVLRWCAAIGLCGIAAIELGAGWPLAIAGAVLMGLGISLGFPVGMSSAADDPRYAAGRVSAAASIGYASFLAGPPVIGFLANHVGVRRGLTPAAVLLAVAFVICRATRPGGPSDQDMR